LLAARIGLVTVSWGVHDGVALVEILLVLHKVISIIVVCEISTLKLVIDIIFCKITTLVRHVILFNVLLSVLFNVGLFTTFFSSSARKGTAGCHGH
jgi:hypothetical protein